MTPDSSREAIILAVILDSTGLSLDEFEQMRRGCSVEEGERRLKALAEKRGNTLVFVEGGPMGAPAVIIPKRAPQR